MLDIFSKFTTHYQKTLSLARETAANAGRKQLEVADLIVALASQRGSLAAEILDKHGLSPLQLHAKLNTQPAHTSLLPDEPNEETIIDILTDELSVTVKKIVERSVLLAWRLQHKYIGTEHLLYALITSDEPEAKSLWLKLGVNLKSLKQSVNSILKSTSKFPDITEAFAPTELKNESGRESATPALDFFCTDLTSQDAQAKVDPVIGRAKEIQRLINILGRRTKNNPLLLGDPGVGKTAIVEGLAKKIFEGTVPEFLQNKKIMALDLGLVVAGTMYRGEFEGRLKQILDELKAHPEIILFIDEVHTIVGTGAAPGSLDLANIIKPALAKGLVRCIGATTQEEYKKSIESDAALERRFQVVQVLEPSPEETVAVLKGIRENYEKFHGVAITDDAIEAAVQLSERYLPEKFLPDKAIDLIDEAAAHIRTTHEPAGEQKKLKELEVRLKQLIEAKELAVSEENFPLANAHKEEAERIRQELNNLKQTAAGSGVKIGSITRQEIAQVVAQMTNVPITDLLAEEKIKLITLEKTLQERLVGQPEAVAAVARSIKRGRLGLGSPNRPLGSFLFLGPSGVGKTELAKLVAEQVFGDPSSLIRLDMSEFAEGFNISKLIGAPAGYVGYKDSNKLTDLVRRKQYSVVLFDEVEKAHPDIFNLLLQVLDEGHLTDAAGKQVNFKNTLIIMTSNLGLRELTQQAKLGFTAEADDKRQEDWQNEWQQTKEQLLAEVKKFFRPEFLNRLDGVIVFNPLSESALAQIVKLQIKELNARFSAQKLALQIKLARGAAEAIARATFSPQEGARGIRRYLTDKVEDPLTQKLLTAKLKTPLEVTLSVKKNGEIKLS
jgi:ATP-dependent Clp protease ATP-binding subunit ClpC